MNVPHNRLTFSSDEVEAVASVVRSGNWIGGPKLSEMEQTLCDMFGASHAVGVGSGLAALRLALLALGVKHGDNVLVPAYSCVALANAVLSIGAKPVAVDVDELSWNINPRKAEMLKNDRTTAVIAVNSFGFPAAIDELKATGLKVIEDCSHGFACSDNERSWSLSGDAVVFSFYASKLIAGGEGGVVMTSDKNIARFVSEWRDYTDKLPNENRLNDKLTDIEASLILCQLSRLPDMLRARRRLAQRYSELLSDMIEVKLPMDKDTRVWYRYSVQVESHKLLQIIDSMRGEGVSVWRPVEWWLEDSRTGHEIARSASETILSLPLYPTLTDKEQNYVCDTFKNAML